MNRPSSSPPRTSSFATGEETAFVAKLQLYLHSAEQQIKPVVEQHLQTRRLQVLDQCTRKPATQWLSTGPTASLVGLWAQIRSANGRRYLITALLILLTLWLGFGSGLTSLPASVENDDIDSALLSDELPLNAYLDTGFHVWLTQKPSQP